MDAALWTALALALTALLAIALWSVRRHRNPALSIECDAPIAELMPSLAGLTLGTAMPGNRVQLLENGRFYDVLIERIDAARHTVHFETYLWEHGRLAQRLAAALAERARAGLKVRLLLDAQGGKKIGPDVTRQLRQAGCRLVFFHKWSLRNLGVLNDRDHRKLCVIDGREAFVGGHCIKDHWLGDAEDGEHYADLSVHLHGPVVHSVQAAFSENWAGITGELFVGDDVFPHLEPAGDAVIHAAFLKPERSAPAVKILHHTALCLARERIWIQNPYFIPEPEAIDAMGEAVRRGVDVRVLMPSASGSDNPIVQHAGHRNFEKLLRCGVRLFEYPHTLLHQKVMTIDGRWSAIGSSNFDDRSFETNDEITLGVLDPALARRLDAVFERYARRADEVDLERWRRRPRWRKARDQLVYLINEVL
ncbi:phospholipase D-like domain-containing protein [Ramlibacter tataouinensis]|uniref:Phospholipase D-like protein n=1 Tax=Ramlibacter tataouinensis (strain ATCC BAA-407 / DSM 14655 / LMG 21543 / TTB310) TaxID=365046 RepID=F5Y6A0_RAMTT|nr:phospholipase D-like domain-containing protein [Ramlibacter tataouinensis]AEG92786.1 phospholipase D-like protein [Ramlibacter tataouinensis TTB310]